MVKLSITNKIHNIRNLTNFHGRFNIGNKSPGLDMDGGYTSNRYPLCVSLTGQL